MLQERAAHGPREPDRHAGPGAAAGALCAACVLWLLWTAAQLDACWRCSNAALRCSARLCPSPAAFLASSLSVNNSACSPTCSLNLQPAPCNLQPADPDARHAWLPGDAPDAAGAQVQQQAQLDLFRPGAPPERAPRGGRQGAGELRRWVLVGGVGGRAGRRVVGWVGAMFLWWQLLPSPCCWLLRLLGLWLCAARCASMHPTNPDAPPARPLLSPPTPLRLVQPLWRTRMRAPAAARPTSSQSSCYTRRWCWRRVSREGGARVALFWCCTVLVTLRTHWCGAVCVLGKGAGLTLRCMLAN